ncbi:amino acid adenylation domain-containing protein [Aquimarina gracilis]|uniref:Amino acid adenylation domain-containing protein n=1 Tax=Aquimarina gracilis TaxID=874422 RepID=A0ABU5ZT51_9FLAO|nr:non-ribosomal peptide synthetase [Aquimarina gracilis]MEB3344961.1 amino acid adenylation domain-containing protein [Aquimarina gracilis]
MKTFLSKLIKENIHISLNEGELSVKIPNKGVNPAIIQEIKSRKEDLILYLSNLKKNGDKVYSNIDNVPENEHYLISNSQQRLWILNQFEDQARAYNIFTQIELKGNYNISLFERAIFSLIERHEILRTVFKEVESGEVRQFVLTQEEFNFEVDFKDFRNEEDPVKEYQLYIDHDSYQPFDLKCGPLLRVALLHVEDDKYIFHFNMHHIISDGWSLDILLRDMMSYYRAYEAGTPVNVPPLRVQYKDYSAWQFNQLTKPEYQEHKKYWVDKLSGEIPKIDLPSYKKRPNFQTSNGRYLSTFLSSDLSKKMYDFIQNHQGSLFMLTLSAVNVLLHKYTHNTDILIGSQVAGRSHPDLEDQIGFYVNVLAIRNTISPNDSFVKFYNRVKENTLEDFEHEEYPYDEIIEALELNYDPSRTSLYDVSLTFHESNINNSDTSIMTNPGVIEDRGFVANKNDIEFHFMPLGDVISFEIIFNNDIYDADMMKGLMNHFQMILEEVMNSPDLSMSNLDYLNEKEKNQLFNNFNKTSINYNEAINEIVYTPVIDLFKSQVFKAPNVEAINYEGVSFNYEVLDDYSDRLAWYLKDNCGLGKGDLVGILQDRSEKMIISILAILKAGGAYVPIDPTYPKDRKSYIIEDTGINILLTQKAFEKDLKCYSGLIFKVDDQLDKLEKKIFNAIPVEKTDLAYIIYTSGSTGKPKGCMLSHGNLSNYIQWSNNYYFNDDIGDFGLFTSLSFDLTITSIFCVLTRGKSLKIYSQDDELSNVLIDSFDESNNINTIKLTPSHISLLEQLDIESSNIQCVIVGGEEVNLDHVRTLKNINPSIRVFNEYGPTETTVGCIVSELKLDQQVVIGKPISGVKVFILGASLELLPIGVQGEICISGLGVGLGYLNNSELSAEKFIPNPFLKGEFMYRTGDIGRWLKDGTIEFFGRKDSQVKIRGYRIELGEIENTLSEREEIKTAVVIAKEDSLGNKDLVAYYTSSKDLMVSDLRSYLQDFLPSYMIPNYFIAIDEVPLTTNGKINYKALPDYRNLELDSESRYVPPRNEIEKKIVTIWQNVLERNQIGVNDDFFNLGGHSLKGIKLTNEYHKAFNVKLSIKDIFSNTSLASHVALISSLDKNEHFIIPVAPVANNYPISDAQRRLWVLSQIEEASVSYNMPNSFNLKDVQDLESLKRSILSVLERHEILRTVFKEDSDGKVYQVVLELSELGFDIGYKNFTKDKNPWKSTQDFIKKDSYLPFDLEKGPLLRVVLLQVTDSEYVLYYNMHHIISDGWSMNVLLRDISSFYEHYSENKSLQLSELRIQYKDFSSWQLAQLDTYQYKIHRDYWLEKLSGDLEILNLPTYKQRPLLKTYNGRMVQTFFSKKDTLAIRNYAAQKEGTVFMFLLSLLKVLFYRYTGQEDIVITSSVAGRDHSDLEDQIGFYINTIALRNKINGGISFDQFYQNVKENLLEAYTHQMYPFDRLCDELKINENTARNPLLDIRVVLQNVGEVDETLEMSTTEIEVIKDCGSAMSKFDMLFIFEEVGDHLSLSLTYNTDIYDHLMIEKFLEHYQELTRKILEKSETKIEDFDYLSDVDSSYLDSMVLDSVVGDLTVLDLFRSQVSTSPDALAIVSSDGSFTYKEIDDRSDRLAQYLVDHYDVESDDLIGILMPVSSWSIISIMAILKSGGCYVPIDSDMPDERIRYIIEDTNIKALCSISGAIDSSKDYQVDILNVDLLWDMVKDLEFASTLPVAYPKDLAYVIYTSGSTGHPKGVMVTHGNLSDYIIGLYTHTSIKSSSSFALMSNIATDLGNTVLYGSLLSGGVLHLPSKDLLRDVEGMHSYFKQHSIDCIKIVPAHWNALSKGDELLLPNRMIIFGGDRLSVEYVDKIRTQKGDVELLNHYGPTETTIGKLLISLAEDNSYTSIPIGKPFSSTSIYVVDKQLKLCPKGVPGELLIGGTGVSRGYLNNAELTQRHFIENPFKEGAGKVYRTGDLVRMLPDETIEFIGRIDNQVKIKGNRVELGEIENLLLSKDEIDAVIVIAKESTLGDKDLVAYYKASGPLDVSELRSYLKDRLPTFMIPGYFVYLEEFPLTSNGKVNKKLLPDPELQLSNEVEYALPRNAEDQILVDVWKSVLKRDRISIYDNFYDLGGDSIKSILIVSRLKQKGYALKVSDLMQTPQLSHLSKKLTQITHVVSQITVDGEVLLSPIQKMFLTTDSFSDKSYYNQSVMLDSTLPIDSIILDKSLQFLVKHHDALRMTFRKEGGAWRQENKGLDHKSYSLDIHDLSKLNDYQSEMNSLCNSVQSSINLEDGPLFKVALFRLKDKDCLLLVIHHLVIDGVSWRILLEDLGHVYNDLEKQKDIVLPKKTDSFQKWTNTLDKYASSSTLTKEKKYWKDIISTNTTPLYKSQKQRLDVSTGEVRSTHFTLANETVELLQTKTHRVYNTEINDILLTGLGIGIQKIFGANNVIIDLEGHGRESISDDVDINRTIGWFTSLSPFSLEISDNLDFRTSLVEVKEALRKIPNKGIGYGILKYLKEDFERECNSSVVFNYLGDFGGTVNQKNKDKEGAFTYSEEYKGVESSNLNNRLDKRIGVSGMLINGALQMYITYNESVYEEKQILDLADAYKNALETIIKELSKEDKSYLTPYDLTHKKLSISELSVLNQNNNIEDVYKLSPLQEGIYYHWISSLDKATYCSQRSYRLHMPGVTIDHIHQSYELLINRHSILRTSFINDSDSLLQIVRKEVSKTYVYKDISDLSSAESRELFILDFKEKDRERGFEIKQDSLIRLTVLDLGKDNYEFVWNNHHIIMDGWCGSILINEFYLILKSLQSNQPISLSEVVPYSNYIQWLEQIDRVASKSYWKDYLSDYSIKAVLPFEKIGESTSKYLAKQQVLKIQGDDLSNFRNICSQNKITENSFIQSVWGYLLSKYNNTDDVVFGSVVSGRPSDINGIEDMVGLFINTIPVRIRYNQEMSVLDLINQVHNASISSLDHHYLNLSEVQSESQLGMDLLDHILVFENYAINELDTDSDLGNNSEEVSILSAQHETNTHYDFDILVVPNKESIDVKFQYNGNLYKEEDVIKIKTHFENVLTGFSKDPSILLKEVSYIEKSEKLRILNDFNDTHVSYEKNKTILDLFEDLVKKHSNEIAVTFENVKLSYKELNDYTNAFASYLKKKNNVKPKDLIAIKLDRSEWMIISILGILKAEGAYLPLDTSYPKERLQYIEEDSRYKVCIDKKFISDFKSEKDTYSKEKLKTRSKGSNPAYAIYTSGSTGKPKGVINSHSGLYNRLLWMRDDLGINEKDVILQKTPYTFDVSVWELLIPCITACNLVFAKPGGHKSPEYLQQLIKDAKVSIVHFVPSMLGIFLENLEPENCKSLRHVICSGEALPSNMVELFKQKLPWVQIHNLYGPTEAAIDVTAVDLTKVDTKQLGVSIGKPVANTKIYIVDKHLSHQSIGIPGELLIEGVQVAQGYLNRPDLNAEKFIKSPFTKGNYVYRTGDLAKWLPNGEISYVGRIDNQVKIRGNRIELGEIESKILSSGYVDNVVVLVKERENSHKHLVGYVVSNQSYTEDNLYNYLKASLPDYMVPSRIVVLEEFPLLINGKIDRKSLSEIEDDSNTLDQHHLAPRNELEKSLANIWEEVLSIESIGVFDNFFRIGGDSILSIRVISKINKKYKTSLTIPELYEFNTIDKLSALIQEGKALFEEKKNAINNIKDNIEILKRTVLEDIDNAQDIEDIYPMSDIQKGMVILSALDPGAGVYHDQFVFQIPSVDIDLFKEAFSKLVWKHETLRTQFDLYTYQRAVQIVKKEASFTIHHEDIRALEIKEQEEHIGGYMITERNMPFKVNSEFLWRIALFKISNTDSIFLFQFHHAILDGWSVASLNAELFSVYKQLEKQSSFKIDKLKVRYRDAVIEELYDKNNIESINFWKEELNDYKRLDIFNNKQEDQKITRTYDFDFKYKLESKCKEDGVSMKAAIYGAFVYALNTINYEDDFVIGVVSNNRPPIEDGEKLLGCFLNTVPVRNHLEHVLTLSLSDYFKEIENNLIKVKKNERLTLYEISKILDEKSAGNSPFFDVMFNYVNFHVYNSIEPITNESKEQSLEGETINKDSFLLTNTSFDFTADALGNSLNFKYKLRRELKNNIRLEDIHKCVESILLNYLEDSDLIINDVDYLSDIDSSYLDSIVLDSEVDLTVLDLFRDQVLMSPDALALVSSEGSFTYKEVDDRSDRLAQYLVDHYDVESDDLIGILMPVSSWSIISILAILKSGGCYVPIDSDMPDERIRYIIEDTNIKALCSISGAIDSSKDYQVDILDVDLLWDTIKDLEFGSTLPVAHAKDLAYVIYTSGSTGHPKGVMVTHGNLSDYIRGLYAHTTLTSSRSFALMSNIATDLGNTVLYGSLLSGGVLHLPSKDLLRDVEGMHSYFKQHSIDCIKIVPAHWNALSKGDELLLPNRMIIFGGDRLSVEYVDKIRTQKGDVELLNHYGPTETTVGKLLISLEDNNSYTSIPIGKPFSSTSIYVVDKQLKLCPKGVPGELLIGGAGVSRGYLNNVELTQRHFIENPFKEGVGKVYRTGDLVRMLPDETIEFIGRIDNQVKLRGFRIELGEIESKIQASEVVENVLVMIKTTESGRKYLIAYVVPKEEYSFDSLYNYLSVHLPEYMIPGKIIPLDEFPLTPNGKINRKALINLEIEKDTLEHFVEPRNEIEESLMQIWEGILEHQSFGVQDNFFRIGGDSLLVVKLKHELGKIYDKPINIVDLFNNTTIEEQANLFLRIEELEEVSEIDEIKF